MGNFVRHFEIEADTCRYARRRTKAFLVDQLAKPEILPLSLQMPKDKRACLAAERLRENHADDSSQQPDTPSHQARPVKISRSMGSPASDLPLPTCRRPIA